MVSFVALNWNVYFIDPSSLEVSPKLSHAEFPNGDIETDDMDNVENNLDSLADLRMPSVGPSPSTFSSDALTSRYSFNSL